MFAVLLFSQFRRYSYANFLSFQTVCSRDKVRRGFADGVKDAAECRCISSRLNEIKRLIKLSTRIIGAHDRRTDHVQRYGSYSPVLQALCLLLRLAGFQRHELLQSRSLHLQSLVLENHLKKKKKKKATHKADSSCDPVLRLKVEEMLIHSFLAGFDRRRV